MRAHVVNETGLILNTVMAEELGEGMIDASIGGGPGWIVIDGAAIPPSPPEITDAEFNAPILVQLAEIDAKTIRPLRDGEADRVAELRSQAAALRLQLRK